MACTQRIVVVEDDIDILIVLRRIIHDIAPVSTIIAVDNAQSALDEFTRGSVRIVITDYNMAGMKGVELCREIKRISHGTKVIMITALATRELEVEARNVGCDVFLTKPFDFAVLEQHVTDILQG